MRLAAPPLGLFGLPSLSEIVEAIAKDFFGALAHALVPEWLSHATVAAIQHLVALPDPATWGHVSQLQSDMSFLGVTLLPAVFAASTLRYWIVGITGGPHPTVAVGRVVWVTLALVAYRWIVTETVDGANTITHAILGFPVVARGLSRVIVVVFGGALLTGTGGVLGALLVIVAVILAVALFAVQVLVTLILALLVVAGPPLIALSVVPELSHLARGWAHLLLAVCLIPLAWAVIFATAGALALDATSFTGGAAGLPGHLEAAFAGLATFVVALRLPMLLLGQARHVFGAGALASGRGHSGERAQASSLPGVERVRAANARLRSVALEGVPSLGRSAGRAAGALGAPQGGAVGVARRGLARVGLASGVLSAGAAGAVAGGEIAGRRASGQSAPSGGRPAASSGPRRRGIRQRLADAGAVLADAPRQARVAMQPAAKQPRGRRDGGSGERSRRGRRGRDPRDGRVAGEGQRSFSKQQTRGKQPGASRGERPQESHPGKRPAARGQTSPAASKPADRPGKRRGRRDVRMPAVPAAGAAEGKQGGKSAGAGSGNPGRRVAGQAQRDARANKPSSAAREASSGTSNLGRPQAPRRARKPRPGRKPSRGLPAAGQEGRGQGRPASSPPPPAPVQRRLRSVRRKPRPGGGS